MIYFDVNYNDRIKASLKYAFTLFVLIIEAYLNGIYLINILIENT